MTAGLMALEVEFEQGIAKEEVIFRVDVEI